MKRLMHWAVKNRAAMNLILIAVMAVGVVSIGLLKREVFPNFELEILLVQVPYPGASPAEVEEGICLKVDEAVRGIDGVKRVTSIAREGLGFAILELNTGMDAQKILNRVRSEVDRIPSFPELAEDPEFQQITFREPAIRVGILADESVARDADWQLREIAETVRDELMQLPSVSQVTIVGERPYQIDVEISEQTLRKYGLSLHDVAEAIRRENVEIPGGKIQTRGEAVLLRGKDKRLHGNEIAGLPVLTRRDGTVLTIADLGTVHDGFDDTVVHSRVNGKSALVLSVDRTSAEDLLRIVNEVKQYGGSKVMPPGYSLATWNDTSIDVRERIDLLTEDGLQGLILVFLVLAIFLEFRLAYWVALGIPFAILATCGVLYGTGGTLNMLTLFSFLMALGLLVDDAIVISENYHSHIGMGKSAAQAATESASEVAPSVIAGVLCTVIGFLPLFFVSGVMGKFIACMPLTVVAMLLISLVEGLTILPCHLGHQGMMGELTDLARLLGNSIRRMNRLYFVAGGWIIYLLVRMTEGLLECFHSFVRLIKAGFDVVNRVADCGVRFLVERCYVPILGWSLQRIPLVLSLQVAFLMVTLTLFRAGWTRYTTFPDMDARVLEAKLTFPDGTPAHVTEAAVRQVAEGIRRVHAQSAAQGTPLVNVVHETVGQFSGVGVIAPDARGVGEFVGSVYVELVGSESRRLTSQQIAAQWRQEVGPITGVETAAFDVQSLGPAGKDIEFKLLADTRHWPELERAAEQTKLELSAFQGVFDISDDSYEGKWEYRIRVNDKARSMGVSTADLAETIRAAYYGEEAMRLQRGRHEVKLMVRYPLDERTNLASLQEIRVRGKDGVERPLTELAQIDVDRGYSEIQRVDQKRAITIAANCEQGANAGEVVAALQKNFLSSMGDRFPGVSVLWEGQKEQDQESVQSLGLGSLVALVAMFVLLTFQLQSAVQPLMILYLVPFAAAGAILGHMVMRLDVTLFSVFGLVALSGLVVNDAIVLLDFINARRLQFPHEPLTTSLLESSRRRIRPVALNTVTSVIGLTPLLADQSFQAQALIPMGVSLVFGLVTSTLLGLFILPTSYYLVGQVVAGPVGTEGTEQRPRGRSPRLRAFPRTHSPAPDERAG